MDFNNLEGLEERINGLLRESKDPDFTNYLLQIQRRVANQKQQTAILAEELRCVEQMYRKKLQNKSVQSPVYSLPIQPEVTQDGGRQTRQPAPQVIYQPVPPSSRFGQPPTAQFSQPMPQFLQQEPQNVQQAMPQQPMPQQAMPQQPMPQQAMRQQSIPQQAMRQQSMPQTEPHVVQREQKAKGNAEFAIGATVLSVVGSIFVLAALVMLGMYFMTGLAKGMILYGGCLAVMILAELLVYRKFPRLGMTLSAVGMGGLYISTLVNYLALKNFNQWVALGITILITLVVIILSRKRDAAAYRILGMSAMYVCILMVVDGSSTGEGLEQSEFITISLIAFIVNIMCLAVPIKKSHTAIQITHMTLNTIFTIVAYFNWAELDGMYESVGQMWQYPFFIALSIVVMQLIFVAQVRWQEKQNPDAFMGKNAGICIAYGFSTIYYVFLVGGTTDFIGMVTRDGAVENPFLVCRLICSAVAIVICVVPMIVLRAKQEKWFIWYLLNLIIFVIHWGSDADLEFYTCVLLLFVASKLLSFTKRPMLRNSDAVITTYCCLVTLINWDNRYVMPLFVGLVLSVLCINYWKTYFEIILTYTVALYCTWHMMPMLELPVFVGIMFVGMFLFNNVERWRGKGIIVYNILAMAGQVVCYFLLINPIYRNSYLTYLGMLIFGITTIVVCLQKHYQLEIKGKPLVMAIFLTYMGLVVRTGYPIVNSILLMLVALGCVGAGFAIQRKSVRVYGLVLSLSVCAKLVLYDFMGVNTLQKTILFFAVGVLALIIASIYMVLERNREKMQRQEANEM